MTYTDDQKTRRELIAESFTADGNGAETTYSRRGVLAVSGQFTATVQLHYLSQADGATWILAGEVTEPGSFNFRHFRNVPWRVSVANYQDGTVDTVLQRSNHPWD